VPRPPAPQADQSFGPWPSHGSGIPGVEAVAECALDPPSRISGFVRIRHFGLLANRGHTAKLARCRALPTAVPPTAPAAPEPVAALMLRLTGVDIGQCPVCRAGRLRAVAVFRPGQLPVPALDTS
jgi:hypothetical protein